MDMACFVGSWGWSGAGQQRCVRSTRSVVRWHMTAKRRISMPGGREIDQEVEIVAQPSPAIQPMRRPSRNTHEDYSTGVQEQEYGNPGEPTRSFGFWDAVPVICLLIAAGGIGYVGAKRFVQRQQDLVTQYGEDVALYGNTYENMREITRTFKKKLGPGVLRGQMFKSFTRELFTGGVMSVETIERVQDAKELLKISDSKAVLCFNEVGLEVRSQPSVLGKILFAAERILGAKALEKLEIRKMFRYGSSTVDDLQRSVLDRVYREACEHALDEEEATMAPAREADVLKLSQGEAESIFRSVVLERQRLREEEAAKALEAEEQALSSGENLEAPVEPIEQQPTVHAYQCLDCGYTLFPAAGREFKFFGSDFACPQCGASKDRFVDLNEEE
ncbi:hypothetical protein NDN08_002604 [Rhodosorus marinus]|uniref:Rubredoxin-like domain-containing protein n=1 Tax=Rhodosorus marinus TaxID=101924 RepID=A0AAV8UU67_9RHOD|nr:hypothetical protein NDN08_002604 [Rhodosorus marinus]